MAPDKMAMDMKHALQGIRAGIEHQPVTGRGYPGFFSGLAGSRKNMAGNVEIFLLEMAQRSDMLAGNNQDMLVGYRLDIPEGDNIIVAVDDIGRDFSGSDFTEQAIRVVKRHGYQGLRVNETPGG